MKHRKFKSLLWGLVVALAINLPNELSAQTNNSPARLAIVPESSAVATVVDLLTVELSAKPHLQLLERAQIEKVYREQGLSERNKDVIKLGQVLGADGLLLFESAENKNAVEGIKPPSVGVTGGSKTYAFTARVIAVRPGVVLLAERFEVASDKIAEWAGAYARRIQPLLPKLAVLAKDAVAVSIVGLRSAVSSTESPELERQLQMLVVERLSREPQLFMLERQKLQQAGEEKKLAADELPFWSGAWLLEGVVDKNAYSKSTITLNAKLTPAKGGNVLQIEASGNRTKLAEVVNALAERVVDSLRITPTVKEWNAADEAARYFAEAKWALDWGVFRQAQAAADTAWALGKRDLECAIMRLKARNSQLPTVLPPGHAAYRHGRRENFVNLNDPPDVRFCDAAREALERYEEFCKTSPDGEAKVLWSGPGWNDWRSSDWYRVGIEILEKASRVLQHFNYSQASQTANADKLAELRAQTRRVAELILNSPSVRESYFTGDRLATSDELYHSIEQGQNIFSCMVNWGCYWQERPEDAVEMYRRLMESPVFCHIHYSLWNRNRYQTRLAAWNENDRKRMRTVWEGFVRELNDSTNVLWRLEAQVLAIKKIEDVATLGLAFTNFYDQILSNRVALVSNPTSVCNHWNVMSVLQKENETGVRSAVRERLTGIYNSKYNPHLEAMSREYWSVTVPAAKTMAVVEKQKSFLREHRPYDFHQFVGLFREKSYSKQQALELLPLISAYKSNILAQAELAERPQKLRLEGNARFVEAHLQRHVEKITQPEAQPATPQPVQSTTSAKPQPTRPAKRLDLQETFSDTVTNIIQVKKFLEIPLDGLSKGTISSIVVTAHRLMEGTLLLDLQLGRAIYSFDAAGKWKGTRYATIPAIAILDIASERWQVIECSPTETIQLNPFYHRSLFWRGNLYTSQGNSLQRYDAARMTWVDMGLPDIGNCGLYVVNERLYGVTRDVIFEILEGGAGMHILASKRRQPPSSALDGETLSVSGMIIGTPALFGDSKGTLRVIAANKVFSQDGSGWREVCKLPMPPGIPQIADGNVLFASGDWHTSPSVWQMPINSDQVEYSLGKEQSGDRQNAGNRSASQITPRWDLPPGFPMFPLPVVSRGNELLVMIDHAKAQDLVDEKRNLITNTLILPQDGYHAVLYNFSRGSVTPQKLYLKFDDIGAVLPVSGNRKEGGLPTTVSEEWLAIGRGNLYLGRESLGGPTSGGRMGELPKLGVWVISLEQLDREIGLQKKVQDKRQAQKAAETGQAAQRQSITPAPAQPR